MYDLIINWSLTDLYFFSLFYIKTITTKFIKPLPLIKAIRDEAFTHCVIIHRHIFTQVIFKLLNLFIDKKKFKILLNFN